MTEIKKSVFDEARAYDVVLGPLKIERTRIKPDLKCVDAFHDAYLFEPSGEFRQIGEIQVVVCNSPLPVATTVESFAVKHGLEKRTDLASCPTLASIMDQAAYDLLISKGWAVSEHMISRTTGPQISFIDDEANRSVQITYAGPTEIGIEMTECTGNKLLFRVNVDTGAVRQL